MIAFVMLSAFENEREVVYNNQKANGDNEMMKLYSYDYVLSQITKENWFLLALFVVLLLMMAYFVIKAYQHQRDSKYRELVIISLLSLLVLVLVSFSYYQKNQASDNQYRTSLHFIENVSEELQVDKKEIYVNTSAATDGAILKVKQDFYRAISGDEVDSYLLEKLELQHARIELVEVEE